MRKPNTSEVLGVRFECSGKCAKKCFCEALRIVRTKIILYVLFRYCTYNRIHFDVARFPSFRSVLTCMSWLSILWQTTQKFQFYQWCKLLVYSRVWSLVCAELHWQEIFTLVSFDDTITTILHKNMIANWLWFISINFLGAPKESSSILEGNINLICYWYFHIL